MCALDSSPPDTVPRPPLPPLAAAGGPRGDRGGGGARTVRRNKRRRALVKRGVYDVCIVTTDQKQTKTLIFQGTIWLYVAPLLPYSCMG